MIRRLCLLLLMFCLALPAMAAPAHCAPMPAPEMEHMGADHRGMQHGKGDAQDRQIAKHECIGCIASFIGARAPDKPVLLAVARLKIPDELQLSGTHPSPDTPPPRS